MDLNFLPKYLNILDVECVENRIEELLQKAISQVKLKGLWLEFGVFTGYSASHIIKYMTDQEQVLFGFDSFKGLEEQLTPNNPQGTTCLYDDDISLFPPRIQIIKGMVQDTLIPFLESHRNRNVAFVNLDMTYTPTKYCLSTLAMNNRLKPGTIIVVKQAIRQENDKIYDGNWRAFIEVMAEFKFNWKYIIFGDVHFAAQIF